MSGALSEALVAAQRRAEQTDRILGVGGRRDQPAGIVDELHLVGLAVPGVAAFEITDRHPEHHRRGEAVGGPPAHRPAIVDLLERRFGIFAELDFRDRHQASHAINLFDMNQKYADVLAADEVIQWMRDWRARQDGEMSTNELAGTAR